VILLGEPIAGARLVVFDTETTGLSPLDDRIIEIAAISMVGGVETGRFESLIDPGRPIPEELTRLHGITDEMVRGKPRFSEVVARFLQFAADSVLAAHNAPYDISMLLVPGLAAGLRPPGSPVLDTCRMARRLLRSDNYRLSTLALSLGIEMPVAHRAMADVQACAGVLRACLERLGPAATLEQAEAAGGVRLRFGGLLPEVGPLPARLTLLGEALTAASKVRISYRGGSHGDAPRAITPLLLLELNGSLNVSAHCHIDGTLKNFRLDRIAGALPAL
jgi:DNA polymerase III epsilon subunit family exonuclease